MSQSFSRRQFLLGSASAASAALLAGCGSDSSKPSASSSNASTGAESSGSSDSSSSESAADASNTSQAASKGANAKVRIASWPFYIEDDQNPKKAPTIANFIKATGRDVEYKLAIDDNNSFTTKYQPQLEKGKSIGFDIAIPTSWMCQRWIERGWVEAIDQAAFPNRVNILDNLANPPWDPGRKFTMPYAIGQVGIAYDPNKTGFEVKTLDDLLKPELKGRITVLAELRDTVGTFLISDGVKPEEATAEQIKKAMARVKKLRKDGQFRKITGNGYIEDLGTGDTWACLAWSGDVAGLQGDNPDIKWVVPNNEGMSFADTMLIPKGGDPEAAAAWMNWIYDPKVAGPLYEAINYASPVKGAGDNMSAAAAKNPLLNPAGITLHELKSFPEKEFEPLEVAWADAIGS
jgi:spermidine/putrescine transport system substrate-binding protein